MWQSLRKAIPRGHVKFKLGDLVSTYKEKSKFAKGYEQTFQQKYFGLLRLFGACHNLFTNSQSYVTDL
jgi:hypothetical protein